MIAATGILYNDLHTVSISKICSSIDDVTGVSKYLSLSLIIFSAIAQSGIWPVHLWLISSLNSPTPISAFMHAGLVNGGALLLARLAPVLFKESYFLQIIAFIGLVSLIFGAIGKLMQNSVKKMLAFSTVSQMGFMFLQCGLGLFSAAIAHMCWHGLFKAFLFLNSGSVIESEKSSEHPLQLTQLLFSLLCSIIGAFAFARTCGIPLFSFDTQIILNFFAALASYYVSVAVFKRAGEKGYFIASCASCVFGFVYGISVYLIEKVLQLNELWIPQHLTVLHVLMMVIVFLLTILVNFSPVSWRSTAFWKRSYVKMMNLAQGTSKSITPNRTDYQF